MSYLVVLLMLMMLILLFGLVFLTTETQIGGYLSPRAGPVDMLQQPKFLIMNGYRFQDTLIPPRDDDVWDGDSRGMWTDVDPAVRPRVGVFRDKAYVIEGYASPTPAVLSQLRSLDDQNKYINGAVGDPIEDSVKPFSPWVGCPQPHDSREVNYPNKIFSWGDVINRYHWQFTLVDPTTGMYTPSGSWSKGGLGGSGAPPSQFLTPVPP